MENQQLFYKKVVPVNRDSHANWAIQQGKNFAFAKSTNSVPVMTAEFQPSGDEYPIVFAENNGGVIPVVVLGLQNDSSYMIGESGEWEGRYVPAFRRRYPFVCSTEDEGENLTLCIDEAFEGCNQDGEGELLFSPDGEQTEFLENVVNCTKNYQQEYLRTVMFCKLLQDLDLLEPMRAQARFSDSEDVSELSFSGISRKKLKALDAEKLAELVSNDALELIYLHFNSLRRFQDLVLLEGKNRSQ